jgi:hypothetical protein
MFGTALRLVLDVLNVKIRTPHVQGMLDVLNVDTSGHLMFEAASRGPNVDILKIRTPSHI